MTTPEHGTPSRYSNQRCRCEPCRAANTAYRRTMRERLAKVPDKQIPHGTDNGYRNYRCRCSACTEANRLAKRDYLARKAAR